MQKPVLYTSINVTQLGPCFVYKIQEKLILPMRGTEEAAGGVESARRRSKRKKATNMFIPVGRAKVENITSITTINFCLLHCMSNRICCWWGNRK